MAQLILDEVTDAELEAGYTGRRRIRTGYVKNIATSSTPDPLVLENALAAAGMPGLGTTYPGSTTMLLKRIRVKPLKHNMCRVWLGYDDQAGGNPAAYVIRNRGYLNSISTDFLPGTRIPIKVKFTHPSDPSQNIREDYVTMSLPRAMRQVSVSGLKFGEPDPAVQATIGYANNATWRGLPVGYWIITGVETDEAKYAGYHSYSLTALTKVTEDWAFFGVLRNNRTGQVAKIDETDRSQLASAPYQYGVRYPSTGNDRGIVRVDPFPTTDFTTITGIP